MRAAVQASAVATEPRRDRVLCVAALFKGGFFMRSYLAALGCVVFIALSFDRVTSASTRVDDEAKVRKALATFFDDPMETDGKVRKVFLDFAEKDENVEIKIGSDVMVWMEGGKDYGGAPAVMCAYVAGSLRSQLETRVWRDDPYSGLVQVVRMYSLLKADNKSLVNEKLDELAKLHADGKLAERVAEIEAAREKGGK